jgi:hypothetical protein
MDARRMIGEILVDLQVLSPSQVEEVLYAMRKRGDHAKFGRVAREMGFVREEHLLAAIAVQLRMFPGIESLSLNRLLDRLQDSTALHTTAQRPMRRHPTVSRNRLG